MGLRKRCLPILVSVVRRLRARSAKSCRMPLYASCVQNGGIPMTAANYELTDEQARGALFYAVRTLQDVMGMLSRAFEAVDEKDSNAIHAAHIRAQRQRIEKMGIRDQERTILRAH